MNTRGEQAEQLQRVLARRSALMSRGEGLVVAGEYRGEALFCSHCGGRAFREYGEYVCTMCARVVIPTKI